MQQDRNPSTHELAADECLDLLRRHRFGRIALSVDALPMILPVDYTVGEDRIVICTGRAAKLSAAMRNAVVAFEVDEAEPSGGWGWSVVVRGMAREATSVDIERFRSSSQHWSDDDELRFITVSIDLISGRRAQPRRPEETGGSDEVSPPGSGGREWTDADQSVPARRP